MKRIGAVLAVAFLLAAAPASAQHGGPAPTASAPNDPAQWTADVDEMVARLNANHPAPFRRYPRADFERDVAALRSALPSMSREQAVASFMRTLARLGDGHTTIPVESLRNIGFHALPLRPYSYADGLFLQAADRAYEGAVGGRIISIGALSVDEVQRRVGELSSYDNPQTIVDRAPNYLIIPELLEAVGAISDASAPVPMRIQKGRRIFSIAVAPIALPEVAQDHQLTIRYSDNWVDSRPIQTPLWLARTDVPYWMEYLPESRTLFVQYNAATSDPGETIGRFARRMREEIATRDIDRVVLDLRHNAGGDAFWNRSLLLALIRSPKLEEPGKLFVLIGRNTFSAAIPLAIDLERYIHPVFVGEPTGGRVQNYGNHDRVDLSASGLTAMVSNTFFQNSFPRDDREWLTPELTVPLTAADYAAGRDAAFEATLTYQPAAARLRAELERAGPAQTDSAFARFMAEPVNRYLDAEGPLIEIGYADLRAGAHERAIAAFQVATRAFPHSANAFDSLGDGYRAAGRTAEAIAAYRRALEITPNYQPSVQSLAQIEGGAGAPH